MMKTAGLSRPRGGGKLAFLCVSSLPRRKASMFFKLISAVSSHRCKYKKKNNSAQG